MFIFFSRRASNSRLHQFK